MRGLFYILIFCPVFVLAQQVQPDTPRAVKQGVIKVRKPSVQPYVKCEYYLTLARVREVEVLVPATNGLPGVMERDRVPVFDSSYSRLNQRVFPQKTVHFSRLLVDQIKYAYPFGDTSSVDTLVVEMWIGKNGKIRWRNVDTTYSSDMPPELELEIYQAVNSMTEWGKGGGYMTPKKFLRKQKRMAESYYCVMYIIASAKPMTVEQKATGARYAPFDIPLNSPPDNEEQRDFLNGNKKDDLKEVPRDSIP